jgi:hypothetical protein
VSRSKLAAILSESRGDYKLQCEAKPATCQPIPPTWAKQESHMDAPGVLT